MAPCLQRSFVIMAMIFATNAIQEHSILTPPKDVTGKQGGMAEFMCEVEFKDVQIMAWEFNHVIIYSYRYGQEDYPEGHLKYSVVQNGRNFTIRVNDLHCTDGGKYTCTVLSEAAEAQLIVMDTPQIFYSPHNPVEGNTAEYICTAQFGGPTKEEILNGHYPLLQMLLDGNLLNGTAERKASEITNNCYNLTQIHSATLKASMHGKVLMCEIVTSNPDMQINVTMTVKLLYSVRQIDYTPKKKQHKVGSVISCSALGNPDPHFVWKDINTGQRIQGESLQITEEMIGSNTWCCTAKNSVSDQSHDTSLCVIFDAVPLGHSVSPQSRNESGKIAAGVIIPICMVIGCLVAWYFYRRHKKLPAFYMPVRMNSDFEKGLQENQQGKPISEIQTEELTKSEHLRDLIISTKEWKMFESDTMQGKGTLNNAEEVHWDYNFIATLKQLLKDRADPAWSPEDSSDGSTLHVFLKVVKHILLRNNHLFQALRELLEMMMTESSVACNNVDGDGKTILHVLVDLKNKKAIPECPDSLQKLILEITKRNLNLLKAKDNSGYTPLHTFVAGLLQRYKDAAQHFVKCLASPTNVDIQNRDKQTALHIFVGFANDWVNYDDKFLKAVKFLRSSKNISLQDKQGRTALQIFSRSGNRWKDNPDKFLCVFSALHNPTVVKISRDDSRAVVDVFSSWAKDLAYHPKALLKIIDTFVSPDNMIIAQGESGETMLHKYISSSMGWKQHPEESLQIVTCLGSPTNTDVRNAKGESALHVLTCKAGVFQECPEIFLNVVKFLKSSTNIDSVNTEQFTALHAFISATTHCWVDSKTFFEVVQCLASPTNIDIRNSMGETALQVLTHKTDVWKHNPEAFLRIAKHLKSPLNTDAKNQQNESALHSFISKADEWKNHPTYFLEVVKCLKSPANIYFQNELLNTAWSTFSLFEYQWRGHLDTFLKVARCLISPSPDKKTPDDAVVNEVTSWVEYWLSHPNGSFEVFRCLSSPAIMCFGHKNGIAILKRLPSLFNDKEGGKNFTSPTKNNWQKCYVEVVSSFISASNISTKMVGGCRALHTFSLVAGSWSDYPQVFLEVLKTLTSLCKTDIKDDNGCTALHLFCNQAHVWRKQQRTLLEVIKCLSSPIIINMQDNSGHTALHIVALQVLQWSDHSEAFLENVKNLRSTSNIDMRTEPGKETPLYTFLARAKAWRDNPKELLEVVTQLVSPHNLNFQNKHGDTVLHQLLYSLRNWEGDPSAFLTEAKKHLNNQNVDLTVEEGKTADHIFTCFLYSGWGNVLDSFLEFVNMVLFCNIKISQKSDEWTEIQIFTSRKGKWEDCPDVFLRVFKCLVSPENINIQNVDGETALHLFAKCKSEWADLLEAAEIIKCLMSPVNIDLKNNEGKTALDIFKQTWKCRADLFVQLTANLRKYIVL